MVIAFLRTIILYIFIIAGIRLMGKRQVGELEPSELVLALLIADLAAVPMQDFGIPLLTGIVPIFTLLCLTMALSVLTMRSVRFRALMCGKPSIIVENGKLHQREMQKNRFTVDELMEELRMQGVTDLTTVKYAILETNGQISVLTRAEERPVTARQMELHPKDGGLPVVIINDGRVLTRNLHSRGLDDTWLDRQLTVKRLWIAAILLCALLGATLANAWYLGHLTGELTAALEESEALAEAGDWAGAQAATEAAFRRWNNHETYLHILLRHADTDLIYAGFQEALEYLDCREGGEYSAANARLLLRLELLSEAERLTLKNVL